MADYRDLLRRAVEALPENNGAARRQVYDKARKALYSQLRAIEPPLPSREITQHRLQLEDCIREVEQRATEQLLGNFEDAQPDEDVPGTPDAAGDPSVSAVDAGVADEDHAEAGADVAALESRADEVPEPGEAAEEETEEALEAKADDDRFVGAEADAPGRSADLAELSDASEAEEPKEPEARDADDGSDDGEKEDDEAVEPGLGERPAQVAVETPHNAQGDESSADVEPADEGAGDKAHEPLKPSMESPSSSGGGAAQAKPGAGASAPIGSIDDIIRQAQLADEAQEAAPEAPVARNAANGVPFSDKRAEPVLVDQAGGMPRQETSVERREPALAPGLSTATSVTAMSAVREVEVEARGARDDESDPQRVIDKAIAALDVEARGESSAEAEESLDEDAGAQGEAEAEPDLQASAEFIDDSERSGNALTIFLVVFVLLLAGVGGAGYWAWREGYVDLGTFFGQGTQVAQTDNTGGAISPTPQETTQADASQTEPGNTVASTPDANAAAPTMGDANAAAAQTPAPETPAATPNTTADANATTETPAATAPADGAANTETAQTPVPAAQPDTGDTKVEDRLSTAEAAPAAPAADNANAATEVAQDGNQALLLEASDSGSSGAVPYSGTVEWTRGTDELGQPTIEAKANIPARNMNVKVLIRKNSDATLPASHLMEIDFDLSDSFIGGGIGRVVGVLMKDKELVQGKPLVGASARVVGNSFLFALTADTKDVATNEQLLQERKWMDLALIYSTGKRAIITLEKNAAAEALFKDVMAIWGTAAPADGAAAPASGG